MRTLSATAALAALMLGSFVVAAADTASRVYEIRPQPVSAALKAFAAQSDMQLIFTQTDVGAIQTPGVSGQLSPHDALSAILKGTGLEFEFTANKVIVVRKPAPQGATAQKISSITHAPSAEALRLARVDDPLAPSGTDQTAQPGAPASPPEEAADIRGVPEILVKGAKVLNMDIRRSRDDAQPYVVLDRERIAQSGASSLENFLRERLPMNAPGMENSQRVTSWGDRSALSLRGLGAGQTLILINGHRTVSGPAYGNQPAQPDINSIPMSAVERIEVLPATASGIYGGSATGGVINIILRQDYEGLEVKATYGNPFEGSAAHGRIDLLAGFNVAGGTNLLLNGSYSTQDALSLKDRASLVSRHYDIARANAPSTIFPPGNPPLGARPNIRSADGSGLVLDDGSVPLNASFASVPAGYSGSTDDSGAFLATAGQYNYEMFDGGQFYNGARRPLGQDTTTAAVRATLHHEFSPRVRAFLDASFRDADTDGVTSTVAGSPNEPYRVSAAAPTNPFTTDILVTVPTASTSNFITTDTRVGQLIGGVIVSLPGDWKAEADYTWARDRTTYSAGAILMTGGDVADILDGTIDVLRDTRLYPVDLSPYLAPPSTITPQKVTLSDFAVRFSGPAFELPAGPVILSSLLEYRKEAFSETLQDLPPLFAILYPSRSTSVASAYLETKLPLLANLELQLAGRMDEYRTHGKTGFIIVGFGMPVESADNTTRSFNPTLALRYQPIEDLALRLSYGTGFVPPDASQLAPLANQLFETIVDPMRGNSAVPIGTTIFQGGNPELDPEQSRSWSAGLIFTPQWARGLRISVDYTRIDKTDNIAIYPTGLQGLVNDEALFPSRIVRGATLPADPPGWAGPITLIDSSLFNISRAEVEAVDVQFDYGWDTRRGAFAFSAIASRQLKYDTVGLPGQPVVDNVGFGFRNPQELSGNAQLAWRRQAWTAGWSARYSDSYHVADPLFPNAAEAIQLQGNGGIVNSQTYHDLFVGHHFAGDTEVQLSVRNIFDELPPFDAGGFVLLKEYYSGLGDALRRTYQVSLTKRF